MLYYFIILHKHKNLFLKRKKDYKRDLIMIFSFTLLFSIFLITLPKEIYEFFSPYLLPAVIILDFTFRIIIKKNASSAVFPYLALPIPRKVLMQYIILSDLLQFWIWSIFLVYCIALVFFGIFSFKNVSVLLLFVLTNNYLVSFLKTLIGDYALLIYPLCLFFIGLLLFLTNILNFSFSLIIITLTLLSSIVALYFTLKENLYKELNRFAL